MGLESTNRVPPVFFFVIFFSLFYKFMNFSDASIEQPRLATSDLQTLL